MLRDVACCRNRRLGCLRIGLIPLRRDPFDQGIEIGIVGTVPRNMACTRSLIALSDQPRPIIDAIASRMLLCHFLDPTGFKQRLQLVVVTARFAVF